MGAFPFNVAGLKCPFHDLFLKRLKFIYVNYVPCLVYKP
jgi:hypothetical protein